jgi:hypothetical protein
MTAPTKNFTSIPDTSIDTESPIDETLMTQIRDNIENLKEWLGYGYTPARAHSHDGVDSVQITGNIAGNLFMYQNYT